MNRKRLNVLIIAALLFLAALIIYRSGNKKEILDTQGSSPISNTSATTPLVDGTEKPIPAVGNDKTIYTISGRFADSKKHEVICFSPDPDDSIKLTGDASLDFCFTNQDEAHQLFGLQNASSLYSDTCLWIDGEADITITNYAAYAAGGNTAGAKLLKVNQIKAPAKCSE